MNDADELDIDWPIYPLAVGAVAANVQFNVFRMYANPKRAPLSGSRIGTLDGERTVPFKLGTTGHPRKGTLLSFRGVLTYALMAPLIEAGFRAAAAQSMALVWTLLDSEQATANQLHPPRRACQLFGRPTLTILVTDDTYSRIVPGYVHEGMLRLPLYFERGKRAAVVSVLVDHIYERSVEICKEYLRDPESWKRKYGWREK